MSCYRTLAALVVVLAVATGIGAQIDVPVVQEIKADIRYGTNLHLNGTVSKKDPWKFNIGVTEKSILEDGDRGNIAFQLAFVFNREPEMMRANYKHGSWGDRVVYDNPLKPGKDFDLTLLIQESGYMVLLDDVLVMTREHILLPLSDFHYFIIAGDVELDHAEVN